ncbi:hypothetical protein DINM_004968 [Dirofilaria immitis]|nr:hypothetical protein [Dirofilaria immitis]
MFNHCFASLTIIVIAAISNQAFILQCQNCRCIPDYCLQTVPRSLCPCDGPKAPCSQTASGMQTVLSSAINPPATKYFLIQQPVQSVPAQISGQIVVENQQQFMQVLSSLQQQMLTQQVRMGTHHPTIPPVYVIRTIEQPGQIVQQVQQISEPIVSSQYLSAAQQVPMLQTQMMVVPSVQQVISPTQQFVLPFQVPTQTVTLQVPVTMAEHCTPRMNACPLGLPSIHAVTECDNITDSTG